MSENELEALMSQFEHINAKHKATATITYSVIGVVLVMAFVGFYMMFGKLEDQARLNEQLAATQQQLATKMEAIDATNKQIADLSKQIADIKTAQQVTAARYDALLSQVNKPLPPAQQDQFFTSRGFTPSYYQNDGGRLFGPMATVKLQTTIVEGEKCAELSAQKDTEIAKKDSLIDTYRSQVDNYVQVDGLRQEEFRIVDTELKKTQKELRREKFWKYFWTTVGTSAGLYAGYEVGKRH